MAFRLLFWGDSSQNNSLADSFAQQAESEFRTTHQVDFENLSSISASQTSALGSNPTSTGQNPASESINVVNSVVSELIQAVTENNKPEILPNSLLNLSTTISDIVTSSSNTANTLPSEEVKSATIEIINSANQTISSISQLVNEEKAQPTNQTAPNISSVDPAAPSGLEELLQKMRAFMDSLRNKVLSFLEQIQKPQVQNYYGVEDNLKANGKKQELSINAENQKKLIEDTIKQKLTATDDNKKIIKKQIKDEAESSTQLIEKAKKSELDRMLERKLEEIRKNPLFEK
jgi:rubrerythrin